MDLFETVTIFDLNKLSSDFRQAHGAYMQATRRGFGYWIWKPEIILRSLEALGQDDVLVYMDAGFSLNPGGRARFLDYVDLAQDHPTKMLSFQNVHTEALWTKADLAVRLGLATTSSEMKTSQLGSGLIFLQKTRSNLDLLADWAMIAVEDRYRYSDDSPSELANHPRFREHRHDQSIASLLRKIRGTQITHYEVQPYDGYFDQYKPMLPAWATRLRN